MAYDTLIVTDRGPVRVITLNRPDVLNALNKKVLNELDSALSEADRAESVRAIVLTGAGEKAFVAGADIAEMKGLSCAEAECFSGLGHRVMDHVENVRVPVIAAVNGFALGGGLELALACDFIYASDNARLGLVEVDLGLIPGFGGMARLARRVGIARAREMIFTGKKLKAEEARAVGLVNKLVAEGEVVEHAVKTASLIAEKGPYAVEYAKRVLIEGQDADHRMANRLEQHSFGLIFGTKDSAEGIEAFMEKRKAKYERK